MRAARGTVVDHRVDPKGLRLVPGETEIRKFEHVAS